MEETVFYDKNGVKVTNARFIVNGQTYTMNGVTSVQQMLVKPKMTGPIVLGILAFLLFSAQLWFEAAIFCGVAFLWGYSLKATWVVALNSSSGENKALSSKDPAFISEVLNALNESIVHRG